MSIIFGQQGFPENRGEDIIIKLSLPSEFGYEKLVWHLIDWSALRLQVSSARIADLQTAVCEACINAIEHGNQAQLQLRVDVTLAITADHIEAIERDEGVVKFCPSPTPAATIEQKRASTTAALIW